MSDLERQIEEVMSRVPASVIRGGLADAIAWKDAYADALKLLKKPRKSEAELTAMLARLNRLAEDKNGK